MERIYNKKMEQLGYTHLVCDIFLDWENVKDEILIPDRKAGSGNGTIHIFLGAGDSELQKEFSSYYESVKSGEDTSVGAVEVKHYFLASNILSLLGYVCNYLQEKNKDINKFITNTLNYVNNTVDKSGFLSTKSLFKLSTGSNKLRPYFKQFESDGVFSNLIRQMLLPDSSYKISLYKNAQGEYAAFWLIGFDWQSPFDADSSTRNLDKPLERKNIDKKESSFLQQIYYGAPGTGKSNKIKEQEGSFAEVYRTTFHPDSDYSTFVGCYKPAMTNSLKVYSADELIDKLSQIKSTGTTYPCHKWAAKYWESLKEISATEIRRILEACELTDSMTTEVSKGIAMGEMFAKNTEHKKIVYSFSAQAFTKAYIEAWEKYTSDDENKNVLLVIEEINRGNCAQIFGDLFQLLDRREDGFSDYPIDADQDLQKYIAENGNLAVSEVYDCNGKDISEEINSGKKLMLPPNLYIWATMNTSDQSLFPIDSAFKRRWDWVYMPIDTEAKTGWKIKVGNKDYSWSSFLEKINDEIQSATSSEDKQLGFFFCKADENGDISAEKFVSKVLFFIYNDVFKDYGLDREFFKEKDKDNKTTDKKITFQSMFEKNGNVKDVRVAQLLDNLGVEVVGVSSIENYDEELDSPNAGKSEHKETLVAVTIDGERLTAEGTTQFDLYLNAIKKLGVAKIAPVLESMKYRRKESPMAVRNKLQSVTASDGYSYVEAEGYYFVKGANGYTLIRILEDLNKELNLNIKIEYK